MPSLSSPHFDFLGLPPEIRNAVYHLCLDVGVIRPHARYRTNFPSIALLGVNIQIRSEARSILYRINSWLLSAGSIRRSPFKIVEPDLFERVEIVFGDEKLFDLDGASMHEPNFDFGYTRPMTEDEQSGERTLQVHQMCIAEILQAWNEKVDRLKTMKSLRHVGVHFEGLYCPAGCDRVGLLNKTPVRRLLKYLSESDEPFVHGRPEVLFYGLRGLLENSIIYKDYGFPDFREKFYRLQAQEKKSKGDLGDNDQVRT